MLKGQAPLILIDHRFDPAHFTRLQPDLDDARVVRGLRQNFFHDAARQPPGAWVLLQHDVNPEPRPHVFPLLIVYES
jgi:hypothetical protein